MEAQSPFGFHSAEYACRILTKDGKVQLFTQEIRDNRAKMVFIQEFDTLPAYFDLEKLLQARPGSIAAMSLADRLRSEMTFNQNSLK